VETRTGIVSGRSGMELRTGDRVTTGEDARAVLSFVDGSSVTLDRKTDILIKSAGGNTGAVLVRLAQRSGNTWTYVPATLAPGQIEIETPTGTVRSTDAVFSTAVQASGRTQVGAQSGNIDVKSGDQQAKLTAGKGTAIESRGLVATPVAAPPPPRELVVRLDGAAFSLLTDASGASAGFVPPGVPLNQMSGASISHSDRQETIRLANPLDGAYRVGVQPSGPGAVRLSAVLGDSDSDGVVITPQGGGAVSLSLVLKGDDLQLGAPVRLDAAATPGGAGIPPQVIEKAKATATASI